MTTYRIDATFRVLHDGKSFYAQVLLSGNNWLFIGSRFESLYDAMKSREV